MKKRISAAVAAALMLTACGNAAAPEKQPAQTSAPAQTEETAVTLATVYKVAELKEAKITIPEFTVNQYDVPETEAMKFVKDMRVGWSLGNTLDATSDEPPENDVELESWWCGAVTGKDMIDSIKQAGFNTVRVPVSWHNHVDADFNINKPFLDRVQEIVDYVIDNGMYCIVNIHHDNEKEYFYPDSDHLDSSLKYVEKIWSQVAERFKDYDEKLIFEGLNEPRLKDTNLEWYVNKNDPKSMDSVECINQLLQRFADTVRKSGGNNAERYLMIPGYCASPDGALLDAYRLPEDSAEDKLIVSVHAYTPYKFALQDNTGTNKWSLEDEGDKFEIDGFMDKLYKKFISEGVPVVIGEFGARNKYENLQARTEFTAYYVASARARGMTCCWWDNNAFYGNGENFGIYDRNEKEWKYSDIARALVKYSDRG